ncbi:MAG: c-type cytochrome [Verrucomicrobiales bacterium]|nr:c-type cytochrome [Verrucomicrobiales bacterium]
MNRKQLWKLLSGLGLAFGVPWFLMILIPYFQQATASPVPYSEEEGVDGFTVYPDPSYGTVGASDYGLKIYEREGCAYCHTQVVRPTYAGPDMWLGWGGGPETARETRPQDFAGEAFAHLGYQRIGQDLSNVGTRSTREELHRVLSDPGSVSTGSAMPSYRHLYRKTDSGWAPTGDAEALVDYLLSRKKDQPLPDSVR